MERPAPAEAAGAPAAAPAGRVRTFLMVKPDGVQRAKMGDIIQKFERRGFKLCGMKLL